MATRGPRVAASLALAALVILPAAAAGWWVKGSQEPDTPQDVAGGRMWPSAPPGGGGDRVYFNVIAHAHPAEHGLLAPDTLRTGRVDPNVLPGSRVAPPGHFQAWGVLGVWRDCDGDGVVGTARGALWHYRSELLEDDAVCPQGSVFNREGWVWEILWIHNDDDGSGYDTGRAVFDAEANVWGDFGLPGDARSLPCAAFPFPHGTMASTGGVIRKADCHVEHRIATTVNGLDPDGSRGIRFEDPEHPERDCESALNRPLGVWHNPHRCPGEPRGIFERDTGNPAFRAWDCSDPMAAGALRDPTAPPGERGDLSDLVIPRPGGGPPFRVPLADEEGDYSEYAIPRPAPALLDPRGSYADAYDHTFESVMGMCGREWRRPTQFGGADDLFYDQAPRVEEPYAPTRPEEGKRDADFAFFINRAAAERSRWRDLLPAVVREPLVGLTGKDMRDSLGVAALEEAGLGLAGASGWLSDGPPNGFPTYGSGLIRGDLSASGPVWLTFYARLGEASRAVAALPVDAPAGYGAEACGGATSGVVNGWDCTSAHWWNPDLGGRRPSFHVTPPRVGDVYHLRDVDCYDGTVHEDVDAHASLQDLSDEAACPDPHPGAQGNE